MPQNYFKKEFNKIFQTSLLLMKERNLNKEFEIANVAKINVYFDETQGNWNGIYHYKVELSIPVDLYATLLKEEKNKIENKIGEVVNEINKNKNNVFMVEIYADTSKSGINKICKNNQHRKELNYHRELMELAIAEMRKSKRELRTDSKVSPKVGAVLVYPDGKILLAHRGELREGDHAEFTLIERKLGNELLDDCVLYTTLEPCVKRTLPKVPCCKRISNARIKTVYVGIIDPDPTVSTKGIEHLLRHNIQVKMFDDDLQKIIEIENIDFLNQAIERKRKEEVDEFITPIEKPLQNFNFDNFSDEALNKFLKVAQLPFSREQPEFKEYLTNIGVMSFDESDKTYKPNGNGILLFGKEPRNTFKGASIKCTAKLGNYELKPESFEQPLVLLPDLVENWLKKAIAQEKDTSSFKITEKDSYPINVLREAVINAIVHRDYYIEGAKNNISVSDNSITIKSPGAPPKTISLEQLNTFKAPSYSRNPVISFVFNKMGYMEETGLGMATFKTLSELHKLPLPTFEYDGINTVITFPRSINAIKSIFNINELEKLNDEELIGYEFIKQHNSIQRKDYDNKFGFDKKKSERHLNKMLKLELINRNGAGTNIYYEIIAT